MAELELKINNRIEVVLKDGDYKCNIQDVTSEHIAITIPMKDRKYYPLDKGTLVSLVYYTEDTIFKFESEVLGREVDRIPIIIMGLPQNIREVQRRNFVRVPLVNNVKWSKLNKAFINRRIEDLARLKLESIDGFSLDISGAGMRITCKETLNQDDIIVVTLPVLKEELLIKAKIVRVENKDENLNTYGLYFFDLDEKVRDKIIKGIFEIMREQRKKGD
jgi:c-di-GMP-binding flagellar brake protein YcgR